MNNTDVPIWEKYTLTIEEASKYFRIGEKKLRKLYDEYGNVCMVVDADLKNRVQTALLDMLMNFEIVVM